MGRSADPDIEELRRAKIRAAALERHYRARGEDGRSELAVSAGREGGRTTVSRYAGGPKAWSLRMNLARRGVPFKWSQKHSKVDGDASNFTAA